jgi:hypothetical protein
VTDDDEMAAYLVDDWLEWSEAGPPSAAVRGTSAARAVVEVRGRSGGVVPRAVVGGEMQPSDLGIQMFRVGQSAGMTLGAARTYLSRIGGALVPGLPPEFAQAVLDGLVRVPVQWDSGGVLVVDRGAYDEVDSSPVAFELAAGILVLVLLARWSGTVLDVSAVHMPM